MNVETDRLLSLEIGVGAQQVARGDGELLVQPGGSDDRVAGLSDCSAHQGLHETLWFPHRRCAKPWASLGWEVTGKAVRVAGKRASASKLSDTFPPVGKTASNSNALGDSVDRLVWLDGSLRPWADLTVHVLSHSLQRGSLVFDYMSVHETPLGACVFRLNEHVDRFLRSCEMMGLPVDQSARVLREAIRETVRVNPGASAVKISGYFASVEIDVVPVDMHVTVAIAAYDPKIDIADRLSRSSVRKPRYLKLWIEKVRANRRDDILPPQVKVSANYASPMTAKMRACAEGYDEIVLVDEDGHLAEGPTTNLFLVDAEGDLITPPREKVLHGVTRSAIIELAKAEGISIREAQIKPEALLNASEAFLTGTTAGVWPIESVDGGRLGDVCPGPISTKLRDRFQRASSGEDPEFKDWLTPVED
jgi:branched-chain amino acid aminotransferase